MLARVSFAAVLCSFVARLHWSLAHYCCSLYRTSLTHPLYTWNCDSLLASMGKGKRNNADGSAIRQVSVASLLWSAVRPCVFFVLLRTQTGAGA